MKFTLQYTYTGNTIVDSAQALIEPWFVLSSDFPDIDQLERAVFDIGVNVVGLIVTHFFPFLDGAFF